MLKVLLVLITGFGLSHAHSFDNYINSKYIEIKAKAKDEGEGIIRAKVQIKHPMILEHVAKKYGFEESYLLRNIYATTALREKIFEIHIGYIRRNPIIKFSYKKNNDENLKIFVADNHGKTGEIQTRIRNYKDSNKTDYGISRDAYLIEEKKLEQAFELENINEVLALMYGDVDIRESKNILTMPHAELWEDVGLVFPCYGEVHITNKKSFVSIALFDNQRNKLLAVITQYSDNMIDYSIPIYHSESLQVYGLGKDNVLYRDSIEFVVPKSWDHCL